MARFVSFVVVALVAIVCLGFVNSEAEAQISVQIEQVFDNGFAVAGQSADLCYIHFRSQYNEPVTVQNLRITQFLSPVYNRAVEGVSIGHQDEDGGWGIDGVLDEESNVDFDFGNWVRIEPFSRFTLACVVQLSEISPQGAQSGDQIGLALRSNQGFLAVTSRGQRITTLGPTDFLCGSAVVKRTFPMVIEIDRRYMDPPDEFGNGLCRVVDCTIAVPEGGSMALVQVPFAVHLEDTDFREGALLTLENFQVLMGSSFDDLDPLPADEFAIYTEDGEEVSGDGQLVHQPGIHYHNLTIQFDPERILRSGSRRCIRVMATAINVNSGVNSQDMMVGWIRNNLSVSGKVYYLSMGDENDPRAYLYNRVGDEIFRLGYSADWIWSDMSGNNGNLRHEQGGENCSRDYTEGLMVVEAVVPQTVFTVFGNELSGHADQVEHSSGETLGLWCRLDSDQPIAGGEFSLSVGSDNGRVVLHVDSVSIREDLVGRMQVDWQDDNIIFFSADGSPLELGNFLTAWVTIPEDIRPQDLTGLYHVIPNGIILSSHNGDEIALDRVESGWFFVGELGDLSQDGSINVMDLIREVRLIVRGGAIWQYRVGDLNQNWYVDAEDLDLLIQAIHANGVGRDEANPIDPGQVWHGNLDDVWQYQLSNVNPVRVFQLTLRGDLEGAEPYLTDRSTGMSLAYHYHPDSLMMKIVVYSLNQTIQPGDGPALVVPGQVDEVIFEKVVEVNPQGMPDRPLKGRPVEFKLNEAYPNPFNATTRVGFSLPSASKVTMALYDLTGREVAKLVNGKIPAGAHSVVFNADGLTAGIYFLRLETPAGVRTQKLMLVK